MQLVKNGGDSFSLRQAFRVADQGTIATSDGGKGAFEVSNGTQSTENDAFITLHRHGVFACYFGMDIDNKLKVGGWSFGANAYEVIHQQSRVERITANIVLRWNVNYHVAQANNTRTLTLPTSAPLGSKIWITKELGDTVYINRGGSELIRYVGGETDQLIFDVNREIVLVRNSTNRWELLI